MKAILISVLVVSMAGAANAKPAANGEIGYAPGSLGYDALMSGDNVLAIEQLMASEKVSRNDPARLINLGQAYARMGRTADATRMFVAAIASREPVDLILADGTIMDSKKAATQALARLQSRIASR